MTRSKKSEKDIKEKQRFSPKSDYPQKRLPPGSVAMEPGLLCFIGSEKYHYTFPEDASAYERSKLEISSELLMELTAGSVSDFSPEKAIAEILSSDIASG